jgi:hypothetical protein
MILMPFIYLSPPPEARAELEMTLSTIRELAARPADSSIFPPEYASQRTINNAYPIFFLDLHALAKGLSITHAEASGWRFLITYAGGVTACADIHFDATDSTFHFGEIGSSSTCVDGVLLLQRLSPGLDAPGLRYEVRLLSIPSLHCEFFWFAAGNRHDIFAPLSPVPNFLPKEKEHYSLEEFTRWMQKKAQLQLKMLAAEPFE